LSAVSDHKTDAMPLVSITVPVYNHERFVEATIRSLIGQTYKNIELILVDDGSSDRSLTILRSLEQDCQSRFVRCIVFEQSNSGIAAALNRGIVASRGSFLFWLASDDLAEPDAIATLLPELLRDDEIGLACGDAEFMDAQGNPITKRLGDEDFRSFIQYHIARKKKEEDFDLETDFGSYRSFLGPNYIPIGCLVRRSHFLEAGYFDVTYVTEDLELWLRLSKVCKFRFVNRTLCRRRLHGTNIHRVLRARISLEGVRLMLREARYCIENGLADEWQKCAEQRLERYRRHLARKKTKEMDNAYQSVFRRLLNHIRGR
jgi:alpha-1,3-rhamnosyltransferase